LLPDEQVEPIREEDYVVEFKIYRGSELPICLIKAE